MLRRFRYWLRIVLPRGEFGAIALLTVLLIDGIALIPAFRNDKDAVRILAAWRVTIVAGLAAAYGVFRAIARHPLYDADYRRWLELSPWVPGRPMPAGPVLPVSQDLIVLLALFGLNHSLDLNCLAIPIMMLGCYLLINAILNRITGVRLLPWLIPFALATMPLLSGRPDWMLILLTCCLPVSMVATLRSLRQFPWQIPDELESQIYKSAREARHQRSLGWPWDLLAPRQPKIWIGALDGVCLSLLLGWLEFSFVTSVIQQRGFPFLLFMFVPYGSLALLLGAVAAYTNYRSPINLWGRLCTFRWLIPKYDLIWISHLVACIVFALCHGTGRVAVASVGTTASLLMVLVFGPRVEEWWLTGSHRINFVKTNQDFIQL